MEKIINNLKYDNIFLKTDKNSVHSYISYYEKLFKKIRYDNLNILEVGVSRGGSIRLWSKYFENSNIYGIDIFPKKTHEIVYKKLANFGKNITIYKNNAYSLNVIEKLFSNIKFDIIIDDGPHTKISQEFFAENYIKLLNPNGILIIEDIENIDYINDIINKIPKEIKYEYTVYDLRDNKNRFDDIFLYIKRC